MLRKGLSLLFSDSIEAIASAKLNVERVVTGGGVVGDKEFEFSTTEFMLLVSLFVLACFVPSRVCLENRISCKHFGMYLRNSYGLKVNKS